jgi:RNA polymerase sigma-70 factor (ECF subfamily)
MKRGMQGGHGVGGAVARVDVCPQHAERPTEAAVRRAIERVMAGDRNAIRMLYVTYAERVARHARTLVDEQTAEDVTQSVFTKLLTELHRYVPGEVPFEAWLLRVTRNAALDELRRARRVVSTATVQAVTPGLAMGRSGAEDAVSAGLCEALKRLPDRQREVVLLLDYVGLSAAEAAERGDRSEAAVHALAYRGRLQLRRTLVALGSAPPSARRGPAPRRRDVLPAAAPDVRPVVSGGRLRAAVCEIGA